jgi:hypothetical protein
MKRNTLGIWSVIVAVLVSVAPFGCSDSGKKERKIKSVDGVAKKIDLRNNVVSMSFVDKEGRPREIQGSVREDTEVTINGRASKLEDVREGDKVTVYYYKEGKEDDLRFVATRVEVKRSQEGDWTSTAAKSPTTQPSNVPSRKP